MGSGTGILSKLFLMNGNKVYGIEPNIHMRRAAERIFNKYSRFRSIRGSAESTKLKTNSIDLITAAQSFHWFNQEKARKEFMRILKPEGYLVIIWNNRKKKATKFLKSYETLLLTYGTDYKKVCNLKLDFDNFFGINEFKKIFFDNYQFFNFSGLKGRLLSLSYVPLKDHKAYDNMITDLKKIFKESNSNGIVKLEYETEVYYGHL